ncbi:MAG TPA: trypsin-like peptidase domain-containing protein [Acidobacteriaceae bacterium]|jgi:serine protease Do
MESSNTSGNGLWQKLRSAHLTTTFAILAVLSAGLLAGSVLTGKVFGKEQQKVDSSDARPLTIPSPVSLSNGFSAIAKQVGPAVVNINTESLPKPQPTTRRNRRGGNQGNNDDQDPGDMQDFLHRFFGGQGGDEDGDGGGGERRALGSGFIVDPKGYIITNNHVVDKADHIYVKLSSDPQGGPGDPGRRATVIGVDKETDIAVIKIDAPQPLPTIKLGNSDGAQVGDWVLAVGSPFGLSQTVSAGIVSAKNRSIDEAPSPSGVSTNQFQKFIQTDAAINPGNSGGPLVDMTGAVIGMNTAIYTQSMGSQGVGFAMPSNILINVYNMLIGPEHKVTRGSIGITFQAAQSSAVGRIYGFSSGGVIVGQITPNGAAAKAGLQPGDVIVAVNGTPVKDGDELVAIISEKRPGTTVKITYMRGGKRETADVGIMDRAKLFDDLANNSDNDNTPEEVDAGQNKLGIKVQAITAAQGTKLGIKGGVVVTNVRTGSFADEIGLSQGNIIVEINRIPITDEASYRNIVSALKPGTDVAFAIRDPRIAGGGVSYVGGTLP